MRKTLTLFWACMLCMFGLTNFATAQNRFRPEKGALDQVQKAVESSRASWLNMFPAGELPEFGFKDQQEKALAIPGKPIEVFNMFRGFDGTIQAQPAGEFLVPLLVDGRTRVFLTVAYFENKWQVVAAGEMNLAQEAAPYISRAGKAGRPLVWLRNLNHSADFIADAGAAATDAALEFTPLSTAARASFKSPIAYRELEARIGKMPVQFD